MDDYYDNTNSSKPVSWFLGLSPFIRAALIFALPFIVADFFNYYSAGTTLVFSMPILALLYAGCGALAGKFTANQGTSSSGYIGVGALAGLALWLISTVTNTIIGLIIGTLSFGTTLLLGLPYLCLCAPVQLIGGGLIGGFGGFIYSLIHKDSGAEDFYG